MFRDGTSGETVTDAGWVRTNRHFRGRGPEPERHIMTIGVSIFLIAIGAILTFATDVTVSGLNLDVVGVILMLVGILGLVLTLVIWGPRRRAGRVVPGGEIVEERRVVPPTRQVVEERRVVPPTREVVEERRTYGDPPL